MPAEPRHTRRLNFAISNDLLARTRDAARETDISVPLSGTTGGRFSGDVDVYAFGADSTPLVGEVKARKDGAGFAVLERWLGDNDLIFLRRDRAEPMVVLPSSTWARLVGTDPTNVAGA